MAGNHQGRGFGQVLTRRPPPLVDRAPQRPTCRGMRAFEAPRAKIQALGWWCQLRKPAPGDVSGARFARMPLRRRWRDRCSCSDVPPFPSLPSGRPVESSRVSNTQGTVCELGASELDPCTHERDHSGSFFVTEHEMGWSALQLIASPSLALAVNGSGPSSRVGCLCERGARRWCQRTPPGPAAARRRGAASASRRGDFRRVEGNHANWPDPPQSLVAGRDRAPPTDSVEDLRWADKAERDRDPAAGVAPMGSKLPTYVKLPTTANGGVPGSQAPPGVVASRRRPGSEGVDVESRAQEKAAGPPAWGAARAATTPPAPLQVDAGHGGAVGTDNYKEESLRSVVGSRMGWLAFFFLGLLAAAFVVGEFEEVLQRNVALSYFMPLLIGHAGNSGSQSVSTVIRAIALKQISWRDVRWVVLMESTAGVFMGAALGLVILVGSTVVESVGPRVGATVFVSLPLVALWANLLGAFLPLLASRLGANSAVTSAPLMTTIVDSSGLVIYFYVAKVFTQIDASRALDAM